jgi:hypothetical protein
LFPYMLHAKPISVFFSSSPEWYLVRSTEHKAPCYAVLILKGELKILPEVFIIPSIWMCRYYLAIGYSLITSFKQAACPCHWHKIT